MKKLLLSLILISSTLFAVDKPIIAPTGSVVIKGNSTVKMQTYNTGAWQDRLTILNDGKIGVGKTPSTALDVNGTISGNGSGLTSLNGSNIASGTVSASYLPVAGAAASGIVDQGTQTFAGSKTFGPLTSGAHSLLAASTPTWDTNSRLWMESGFGSRYDGFQHRFDVGVGRT